MRRHPCTGLLLAALPALAAAAAPAVRASALQPASPSAEKAWRSGQRDDSAGGFLRSVGVALEVAADDVMAVLEPGEPPPRARLNQPRHRDMVMVDADDEAMVSSAAYALACTLGALMLHALMRRSRSLQRLVFSPRRAEEAPLGFEEHAGLFGVFAEARAHIDAVAGAPELALGLEPALAVRFMRLNVRLLLLASALCLAGLAPLYSVAPSAPPPAGLSGWGVLQVLTLTHLPHGDWRLYAVAGACAAFTAAFLTQALYEWRWYLAARHGWLATDAPHRRAVLLTARSAAPLARGELAGKLNALLGEDEVLSVRSLAELRGGADETPPPATRSAAGAPRGASAACAALAAWLGGAINDVACDAAPCDATYLVLFRTRRAAALAVGCSRWPSQLVGPAETLRSVAAPSFADAHWPGLLASRLSRRGAAALASIATACLYLFWTIPVAFVQAMATVSNLMELPAFGFLATAVHRAGPAAVAAFEGSLSSLLLIAFRQLTLHSGLFELLVRLQGAATHTDIASRAASRIFLFQLCIVLLGSLVASSLFDTLYDILEAPLQLPYLLADRMPDQANFFLHYVLNSVLFTLALNVLQAGPLLLAGLDALCCCAPASRGCAWVRDAVRSAQARGREQGASGHTYVVGLYAQLVLISSISLTFMFVAPLAPAAALLFFGVAYPAHAAVLRNVHGPMAVDTGGAVWASALYYQTYGLVVAQTLLCGVLSRKGGFGAAALVFGCLLLTVHRERAMRRKYGLQAEALPLQTCAMLDEAADARAADKASARPSAADVLDAYRAPATPVE